MAQHRELIHLHLGLILAVDGAMSDQTGSSDHVGSHTITNEHDDVLCLADLLEILDSPGGSGLSAVVVSQNGFIFTRFAQVDPSIGL